MESTAAPTPDDGVESLLKIMRTAAGLVQNPDDTLNVYNTYKTTEEYEEGVNLTAEAIYSLIARNRAIPYEIRDSALMALEGKCNQMRAHLNTEKRHRHVREEWKKKNQKQ